MAQSKNLEYDISENALRKETFLLVLLALSIMIVTMNTTMFNVALPLITKEYGMSAPASSWIVTGYSILFAISSITFSRLSDFVPIRRLFILSLSILSAVSIVGLFSDSYPMLLLVRLLQAAVAGAIPSLCLVFTSRYIPVRRRGKFVVNLIAAVSLGLGLGPVVAGVIIEDWNWQDLFFVTAAPLILIPFLAMELPREQPEKGTFDIFGAILIGIGTTGLLMFVTNDYWIALFVGLCALFLFVVHIFKNRDPFIQPKLFRHRTYLTLVAIGVAAYMCNFANLFLMPQVLINLHGLSTISAGLIIFPGALVSVLLPRLAGKRLERLGNAMMICIFSFMMLASTILFALFASHSYMAILFIYMLMSTGFTFVTGAVSNEVSQQIEHRLVGSGMGLLQLLQFFSGAFGVGITAKFMSWQKEVPFGQVYSHVYWGMLALVILAIVLISMYLLQNRAKIKAVGER
ncbi:MFS transporter [Pullulanibacillus camelliae]|uniref:MFS transporter n=1 Tax=Pullulanibacillus camelliae TaxID=1707096 RepID=A0A8J2VLQ0_9BACL|nr:MFS transporter [Pullulanibacillus camelliae]GGE31074.1 MFS transporter [Pullulanibacillus camelliae]